MISNNNFIGTVHESYGKGSEIGYDISGNLLRQMSGFQNMLFSMIN